MFAVLFLAVLIASRIPVTRVFKMAWPVYVLVSFSILFNMFLWDAQVNTLVFTWPGFWRGCFFAVRILLLVWMCLVVCFSTTSTEMVEAMSSFLRPLNRLHVPSDDIAMVFSIALRFIPLTAEEFERVKNAQWSRGAKFDEGGLIECTKSYTAVLVPMFVGMFRKADSLAQAMDVRCYALPGVSRTSLNDRKMSAFWVAVTAAGCALLVVVALLL